VSWLSQALGGIGHAATEVGHAVGGALNNPLVDTVLAAGGQALGMPMPITMAALKGLGGAIAPGGNLGTALGQGAIGLGEGALAGGVGGLLGGGAGGAAQAVPGAASAGSSGGLTGLINGIPGLGGLAQGLEKSAPSLLGNLGSFLTGNGGMNALGIAQGLNAANLQKTANNYATDALGTENALWNSQAPMRAQALAQLPGAINANPFSRGMGTPQSPTSGGVMAQPIPPSLTR